MVQRHQPRSFAAFGWLAVVGALATLAVGCQSSNAAGCGPIRREALDQQYLVHVLPGAAEPKYLTDPPTSGAHQPAPPYQGVLAHPLPRPVQVGVLESGKILIQYRSLSTAELARIRSLAGPRVVVAPNPDLPKGPRIVATAWQAKRSCTTVDTAALRTFITTRRDKAPGSG